MANPNPSPKTRFKSGNEAKTKGRIGGKRSGEVRRNYASLKECFKDKMTDEMKAQAFDKLWAMFQKGNNLNAYDRIASLIEDSENSHDNNDNGGGIMYMPPRDRGGDKQ